MTNGTPSTQSAVKAVESDGIVIVTLDQPGTSANILSDSMFDQLESEISPWIERTDLRGLILYSAKPKIFVAGADLVAINETLDRADKEIIAWCDRGRAVMGLLRRAPFMTVAAIHGACVGGGFELTMWCDKRIATDDRRTVIGLPESKLGLVPGWGGTFHVARIGALKNGNESAIEIQIEMVIGGGLLNSSGALESGLVDEVVTNEGSSLLDAAHNMIEREASGDEFRKRRAAIESGFETAPDGEALAHKFGVEIVNNREIFPFAPTVALEHMIRVADQPLQDAADSESVAMSQVYGSPASYGLINNFFLGDHNRKNPGHVDVKLADKVVKKVGLVGAGMMGRLIAKANLARKIEVIVIDNDPSQLEAIASELGGDGLTVTGDYSGFADCDLVIETASENAETKKRILTEIEQHVDPTTIIATNTSAIPVSSLATALKNPGRFCGIHFCHPTIMLMTEVIKGEKTGAATMANAVAYVRSIRKTPVAVHDCAGFVVNRVLSALLDQSLRSLEQGHLMISIDGAMRQFGFAAGPFEVVDIIGADTCMYAGQSMWSAGQKCVSSSVILPRLVKLGRTGRKAGSGFYRYTSADGLPELDPETGTILEPYINDNLPVTDEPEAQTQKMVEQILSAAALEASRILEEGIVNDCRDIDLAVIHGFGFPAHHGGILFWADRYGLDKVVSNLEEIAQIEPRLAPTQKLKEMSSGNLRFYAT
ncbi:MAG: 3-hydroxyacyl-CoA dehydrogenase NAD-binding domain-containing protein [Planctomycetota bacterium]